MRLTISRAAVAVLAVVAPLVLLAAPAEAAVQRRPTTCTTTLVYEHSGTDANGPFTDRAYVRDCGRKCTLYYTTTASRTRLVWTDCTTPRRRR